MDAHLRRTDENVAAIEAVAARGERVGLRGILDDLDRQAVRVPVPGLAVDWGFTWNDHDRLSPRWWPQGITTSADASDDEVLDGRRVLITSAYSHVVDGRSHGSRITVVDLDTLRYRNVLLVVPDDAGRCAPLLAHAGGIAWYGPYLHIAGTRAGLYTCRIDDLLRLPAGPDTFGYEYALPVRFAYESVVADGIERLRYSFLSLDRSTDPPHLIAGEYGRDQMTQRLVSYPLDPASQHLDAAEDGRSLPVSLEQRGVGHMQGATVVDGRWYLTSSRGQWKLGSLFTGVPGDLVEHRQALPNGPEDLTYWPGQDAFWSLSEYPGRRYVFCVQRSALADVEPAETR